MKKNKDKKKDRTNLKIFLICVAVGALISSLSTVLLLIVASIIDITIITSMDNLVIILFGLLMFVFSYYIIRSTLVYDRCWG